MPLEATMIIIDNSQFSRNGDILPNRFDAQTEALSLLANAKLQENLESSVGLMTMGGKVECLVSLISEAQPIMATISEIQVGGDAHFVKAIQIAKLALKHRKNKNQRQRIMVMVSSPIAESQQKLSALGRKLKRDNIALNVLNLGEAGNVEKLRGLVDTVNNDDNSHFMNVEASVSLLSDVLVGSPFMGGSNTGGGMGGLGGMGEMDEQLEMVIRMSLEEEERRQAALREEQGDGAMEEETGGDQQATQPSEQTEEQQDTALEKELIQKAQELSLNDQIDTNDDAGDISQLVEDPEFLGELMKDLDIDPEDDIVKGLIDSNKDQGADGEDKKDGDQE